MSFAENFSHLKNQKGVSNYEIAHAIDCSQSSIKNWETGEVVPRPRALEKIAAYFGITVGSLTGDELPALPPEGETVPGAKKETAPLDDLLPGYARLTEENKRKAQEYIALLLNAQHTP